MKKVIRLTENDLHRIVKNSVNRIINEVYAYGKSFHGNRAEDWKELASERENNARENNADVVLSVLTGGDDYEEKEKLADKNARAAKRNRSHAFDLDTNYGQASSDEFHRKSFDSHCKATKSYNSRHPW